ncbi:protein FAR1-RELATED SEQUENCE 5-like [Apium graveolens]|uniref:protein FAR1-RELATED SEQUENCE 5-like n=1 Tax=Apium graveolens TaxID=4045 RepID=UPI003D795119
MRKSTKKMGSKGILLAKYVVCNRAGTPYQNRSKILDDNGFEVTKPRRKITSRRCNFKAQIILKPAGQGFVFMGFIEEHNHPLATRDARIFLRCNRNLSVANQNFIMDSSKENVGVVKCHAIAKEMMGSYEDICATVNDFKNFSRDVKVRIGPHDADMILEKFKLKETSNNKIYYDYKVYRDGHLTGLFWTDAIGQANFDVFGDMVSFDPTFRTNKYVFQFNNFI